MTKINNWKSILLGLVSLAFISPNAYAAVDGPFELNDLEIVITPDHFPIIWYNADKYKSGSYNLDLTYVSAQVVSCAGACASEATAAGATSYRNFVVNQYITVTAYYDAAGKLVGTYEVDNTPPPPPTDDPVVTENLAVGSLQGAFNVTPNGSASYSVGLDLPPGIAGLKPSIGISYDSQAGNGLLGMGWGLSGLSEINRCPKTLAQDNEIHGVDYSVDDAFCLDGQRLISIGVNKYRTEVGNSVEVLYSTTQNSFTVYAKDGSITEYGGSADSNIESENNGPTRVWAINKVSDQFGNFYTYSYTEDNTNGAYRIASINYAANKVSVNFEYEDRTDLVYGYQAGRKNSILKKLDRITVNHIDYPNSISTYDLAYFVNSSLEPTRLKAIQKCNVDQCLPATTFEWNTRGKGFYQPQLVVPVNAAEGKPSWSYSGKLNYIVDVDGDGKTDRVWRPHGYDELWVTKSIGNTFGLAEKWLAAGAVPGGGNTYSYNSLRGGMADVNGDGLQDRVWIPNGRYEIFVALSDGTKFLTPQAWLPANAAGGRWNYSWNGLHEGYADMDGDGRSDRIWIPDGTHEVWIAKSTGTSFATPEMWLSRDQLGGVNVTSFEGKYIQYVDINGDGMSDRVWMPNGTYNWYVALSHGDGFKTPEIWLSPGDTGGVETRSWEGTYDKFVDVNGDGLLDKVWRPNGQYDIWVALSTGTRLATPEKWLSNNTGGVKAYSYLNQHESYQDINADGLNDKVWIPDGINDLYVAYSDGTKFTTPTRYMTTADAAGNSLKSGYGWRESFADMDGDGSADRVWMPSGQLYFYGATSKAMSVRISNIDNGASITRNIQYKPLTDSSVYERGTDATYPEQDIQYPQYVVSEHSTTDGLDATTTITYKYGGARVNLNGRGNLGFDWTESTNTRTGLVSHVNYYQSHPYTGMVNYESQILNGNYLSYTTNTAASFDLGNGRVLPYINTKTALNYDINGTLLSAVTTTSEIVNNVNGDVTDITVDTVNIADPTEVYTTVTHNEYGHQSSSLVHLQSLVTESTVYKTGPKGTSPTATQNFTYNLTTGKLLTEAGSVTDGTGTHTGITKTYSYSNPYGQDFGHIMSTTITGPDIETRIVKTRYDSIGQFPEEITNELGHTATTTYDPRFGVPLTKTDANGLVTTYQYNDWGELTDTYSPGGNTSHTEKTWCVINCTIDAINPSVQAQTAKFIITTSVAGGISSAEKYAPDVVSYYDKLGREIRKQTTSYDGQTILQDTAYDDLGRVVATTKPYFFGDPKLVTTVTYDALNRPETTTSPDEGTATVTYSGFSVTTEKNH